MYEDNDNKNNQMLLGKRKLQIDDEGPVSKKAQKNKWKKQKKCIRQQAQIQEFQQSKPSIKKNILTQDQKYEIMVDDLRNVVGCGQSLIRQKLKQANYNKQMALNLILNKLEDESSNMMDLFDKKQQKKSHNSQKTVSNKTSNNNNNKPSQKKFQSNKIQQQAYKLLNDIYEKSQIQISGFQFEQLFNEITEIIKEDQKQKGKGVIQINNFVENCMTAKDAILVGLKDVFKVEAQIEFDENDPVHIQLQNFIYQDTQKQVQQQVINKEEFPTLGESSKKKNTTNNQNTKKYSPPKSSIVNQIQNQNRHTNGPIRKQDLFQPANSRPVMFTQKNSIFNVDNQQQSQDALRQLHKQYNHVSIHTLKIVYLTLDKNFHQSRTFLERYYPKQRSQKKISIQTNSPKKYKIQPTKRHFLSAFRKQSVQEIDGELQRWTLSELRSQIQHLYGLRQVFLMTCKNIVNSKQRQQLMRIADDRAPISLIRKLSKASRVKLIEQTMRINPHYVDLHGYRQEEVSLILEGMVASIRQNFDRGNQRVRSRTIAGRTEATIQIMTGKGRHSQYGKSILKPCVRQWCQKHNIRAIVNDDNVQVFVPLV